MIIGLTSAWLTTLLLSAALDMVAIPRGVLWHQRPARSIVLHLAAMTWLFILFLALWARPWFAMVCAVGLIALLIAVSNAKFKALREPIVFSDLVLFAQSIRHPRLYFPYLSLRLLLALIPAILLLACAFMFDSVMTELPVETLGLVWLALIAVQIWLAYGMVMVISPVEDQPKHGFFSTFVSYLLNGLSFREIKNISVQLADSPYAEFRVENFGKKEKKQSDFPDVLIIQSESFFDVRKIGIGVDSGLLMHFDSLKRTAIKEGELSVPAWGANTMRTEHAFLSGLRNSNLRYGGFYPYAFVRRLSPAMPHLYKKMGYNCSAVHPYPADFFLRKKVFPRLGFDEFADESHFLVAEKDGPYISDSALTDWLIDRLEQPSDKPRLIFAITMENHGPFHLEKSSAGDAHVEHRHVDLKASCELAVYLRHLGNADGMLGRLQEFLARRKRKTLLCFYGDHVPGMSHVYASLNNVPKNSDFLIWGNHETDIDHVVAQDSLLMTPEQLGVKLTTIAGLM